MHYYATSDNRGRWSNGRNDFSRYGKDTNAWTLCSLVEQRGLLFRWVKECLLLSAWSLMRGNCVRLNSLAMPLVSNPILCAALQDTPAIDPKWNFMQMYSLSSTELRRSKRNLTVGTSNGMSFKSICQEVCLPWILREHWGPNMKVASFLSDGRQNNILLSIHFIQSSQFIRTESILILVPFNWRSMWFTCHLMEKLYKVCSRLLTRSKLNNS